MDIPIIIPLTVSGTVGDDGIEDIPITISLTVSGIDEGTGDVPCTVELNVQLSTPSNGGSSNGDDSESWIERYWWTLAIIGVVLLGVGIYLLVRYWPTK